MEKVDKNVKQFHDNAESWIGRVIKAYWKECVTITQERILLSTGSGSKFKNQACMKIVSNFLTTLTASNKTKQMFQKQIDVLKL